MASRQTPGKRGATTSKRRPAAPKARRGIPGWLWGITGVIAGFLLSQHQMGVAPWQVEDSPLATVLPRSAPPSEETGQESTAPPAQDEPRMPTFEFYTLLPESEVIAPRGELPASTATPPPRLEEPESAASQESQASSSTPASDDPIAQVIAANLTPEEQQPSEEPAPAAASGSRYMLQAASFREPGDAEQLRGRLRDFGLLAQVSEVKASGGQTWHRVQVGPYADSRELNRAQDLMVTQGIEPLLIRLQN
ncbi:SPOR domain-containing protein [Halomonas urumqiensis]|uniref:SPOR domain-containing protein n=1 Tax=Halomonas urumqiensis TaxID=1684789 RepID=A0A2N7UIM7_9GAMM|nr:SPOR domain-containing protein [Halomonas urumqiensis]PMR80294.1 SPOR domain-containing protein [Halomonas urumqiensis]PTB01603.1 SPOR domain-containing protein [Halomonas urumqiensis]GHE22307.1 hypothetical protein GCM10017767_28280 [Halomonas urumqiensis]